MVVIAGIGHESTAIKGGVRPSGVNTMMNKRLLVHSHEVSRTPRRVWAYGRWGRGDFKVGSRE